MTSHKPGRVSRRVLALALVAGALTVVSNGVMAGECPADKVIAASNIEKVTEAKGVTDTVISSINLVELNKALPEAQFRMRRLVVQPGGVVPLHSHSERPANIYMVEGEITEYRDTCAVPVLHKAGEVVAEFGALSHWWKNNSDKPAVLISADIINAKSDDQHVM